MERQIERWNGSATLRAMLAGHGVSFVTVQPAPTQSPSATGAVQHSAAVPTVSAVTVAAGLAFVFVASAVHTKSAPQVPGVGAGVSSGVVAVHPAYGTFVSVQSGTVQGAHGVSTPVQVGAVQPTYGVSAAVQAGTAHPAGVSTAVHAGVASQHSVAVHGSAPHAKFVAKTVLNVLYPETAAHWVSSPSVPAHTPTAGASQHAAALQADPSAAQSVVVAFATVSVASLEQSKGAVPHLLGTAAQVSFRSPSVAGALTLHLPAASVPSAPVGTVCSHWKVLTVSTAAVPSAVTQPGKAAEATQSKVNGVSVQQAVLSAPVAISHGLATHASVAPTVAMPVLSAAAAFAHSPSVTAPPVVPSVFWLHVPCADAGMHAGSDALYLTKPRAWQRLPVVSDGPCPVTVMRPSVTRTVLLYTQPGR